MPPASSLGSLRIGAAALLALLFVPIVWLEYRGVREDRQLERIINATVEADMDQRAKVFALSSRTHELMGAANARRNGHLPEHVSAFETAVDRLLIEGGECGAYSIVLARLLQLSGVRAQVAQMQVDGRWGAHIVTLAHVDEANGPTPIDSLFEVHFEDESGKLANADDVLASWDEYASQPGPEYPQEYDYDALRLTNWGRIPVLLPLLRDVGEMFFGEEAVSRFSLRAWTLNQYRSVARALEALALVPLAVLVLSRRRASSG